MPLDPHGAREHLRARPPRREDPGEAERIAAGNRNPRRLRGRGSQVASDPLGKGASPKDQYVASSRHVLFSVARAFPSCCDLG